MKDLHPWTIKQLKEQMAEDLKKCHTKTERQMVKTICGKEIKKFAEFLEAKRKLTPGEIAIAQEFWVQMKKFKELFNEKFFQPVYHGTHYNAGIKILKSGKLNFSEMIRGSGDDKIKTNYKYFLSTTRSLNSSYIWQIAEYEQIIVFKLNAEKLSNNFYNQPFVYSPELKNEYEERWLSDKSFIDIKRYVTSVYCLPHFFDQIEILKDFVNPTFPIYIFENDDDLYFERINKAVKL